MDEWLAALTESDRLFVRTLVLQSGSLKSVAKIYGVSYPTIRARLDRIIEKISVSDNRPTDPFVSSVLGMVIDGVLSQDIAERVIHEYRTVNKKK